jgi:hypothetical protein
MLSKFMGQYNTVITTQTIYFNVKNTVVTTQTIHLNVNILSIFSKQ